MSITPLQTLSRQLDQCDEASLPPDLLDALYTIATKASNFMNQKAGEFLHRLDNTQHSEEQVQSVIDSFPKAISYKVDNGRLPIQSAATYKPDRALSFVPLLAREGRLRNVGGEGKRGGLFTAIPHQKCPDYNRNVIQLLANISKPKDVERSDLMCLQVLQKLKAMDLLRKEDILKYDLLYFANHPWTKARYDFFACWVPDILKIVEGQQSLPLIHAVMKMPTSEKPKERFGLMLKTNMKLFPEEFGFLFAKHQDVTTCEVAFDRFGTDEAMAIIRKCIPPSENHPILHHVIQSVPRYMDIFTRHYFHATYLRDEDNRSLFLASLASGNKSFTSNASFFSTATDDNVTEKDPVTDLFPFALAASDETSDLDAVYTLLRRAPGLIGSGRESSITNRPIRFKKRKRHE